MAQGRNAADVRKFFKYTTFLPPVNMEMPFRAQ